LVVQYITMSQTNLTVIIYSLYDFISHRERVQFYYKDQMLNAV
jgi:hypothetical protein